MEVIDKIKACRTMDDLDTLRKKIHLAASRGKIDFKLAKATFMKKKKELIQPKTLREKNWGRRSGY